MSVRRACLTMAVLVATMPATAAIAQEVIPPSPASASTSPVPLMIQGLPAQPAAITLRLAAAPAPADNIRRDALSLGAEECAPTPETPAKSRRIPLEAYWENGLRFESADDQFHFHVGGLANLDSVMLLGPRSVFALPSGGNNGVGNSQATQIRRAVLQMDGDLYGQFDYKLQVDFANASNDNSGEQPPSFGNLTSSPAPQNIWIQLRDVPCLGNVRVGNQDKTIGMTSNTSGAFLPFMERPEVNDAFYGPFDNGFSLGIAIQDWTESERVTWRYGIFQPATNVFGVALNRYTLGARLTALPWYEDEGQRLCHIGLGYWGGELVQDELRNRARPLLRNAPGFAVPILADTGEVKGSKQYTFGPEFATVIGPLTVQAEYAGQFLTHALASNGNDQGTIFYHGGYVEALYFLTGEHQDYQRREGVFGRVVPLHDLHWKKGDANRAGGAWQLGMRFSYLDLNDKAIQSGQIYTWTAGVNWYMNPSMKAQLNYIVERRDTPGVTPGWINGIGMRVAYDF